MERRLPVLRDTAYVLLRAAILITLPVAAAACARAAPMTIVRNGAPNATIVVAAEASDVVKDAVRDLQRYVEKISGATLPIKHSADAPGNRILVGRMPAVNKLIPDLDAYDLGHDGIVVKSFPSALVLTGRSDGCTTKWTGWTDCGTPNALYYFLETLGCRWYMPGPDGEVVPRKTTITVPQMNITSKPDFLARIVGGWAARQIGEQREKTFGLWARRNRLGGNRYHEGHSTWGILNPKEYFASHPEYFSLRDGKRQSGYSQICTSNPEVIRVFTQNLLNLVRDRPPQGWRSYPVGHNDSVQWCECPRCQALEGDKTFTYGRIEGARVIGVSPGTYRNVANRYLKFANAIAEKSEQSYPDCLITFYCFYCLPGFPEDKPRDNLLPVVTHFWDHAAQKKMIRKWADMSKHLYYYGYVGYHFSLPKFGIVDDIRWCHEHKGIAMTFAEDEHSPMNMVTCYLIARAMWDVNTDAEKVLAEFYEKYYGAASLPMKRFFETFDAATREATREWDVHTYYPESLTQEIVAQCRGILTQAMEQAKAPVVKRRIEAMSGYWRTVELRTKAERAIIEWRKDKTKSKGDAARKAARSLIDYVKSVSNEFFFRQSIHDSNAWINELDKGSSARRPGL